MLCIVKVNEGSGSEKTTTQKMTVEDLKEKREKKGGFRRTMIKIVSHSYCDIGLTMVILANVAIMATESYGQPQWRIDMLEYANLFFTGFFVFEALVKIYALGFHIYFDDKWNRFDFLIMVMSAAGIVFEMGQVVQHSLNVDLGFNPSIIRVMRLLRIARVLKLLKMASGVRKLLETVIEALPQVGNLGLLFLLLFFVFAALGVELFGTVKCTSEKKCEGLGRHASFESFGIAWLTLFRVATGDNWNGIMKDALRDCQIFQDESMNRHEGEEIHTDHEECTENCCISGVIAPIYFVIFVMRSRFIGLLVHSYRTPGVIVSYQFICSQSSVFRNKNTLLTSTVKTLLTFFKSPYLSTNRSFVDSSLIKFVKPMQQVPMKSSVITSSSNTSNFKLESATILQKNSPLKASHPAPHSSQGCIVILNISHLGSSSFSIIFDLYASFSSTNSLKYGSDELLCLSIGGRC